MRPLDVTLRQWSYNTVHENSRDNRPGRRRMRTLCLVALSALCACGPQRVVTVSQSEISIAMLQQVQDEGSTLCRSNGGLKGAQWPFSTLPGDEHVAPHAGGWTYDQLTPETRAEIGKTREQYEVDRIMDNLAANAPKSYASDTAVLGSVHPTYICSDGSEVPSVKFLFVP
jgi:hypothetical protein